VTVIKESKETEDSKKLSEVTDQKETLEDKTE
jgi:hypothetical protein